MIILQFTIEQFHDLLRQEFKTALTEQRQPAEAAQVARRSMDFDEFCKYANITKQTGYRLTSKGEVPFFKRSKKLWFDRQEIDNWLLSHQRGTRAAAEKKANEFQLSGTTRRIRQG